MKGLYNWGKSTLNKIFASLYEQTWIIALAWTILAIVLDVLFSEKCSECANTINWIKEFGLLSMYIFFATTGALLSFTLLQIRTIRNNVKNKKLNYDQIDEALTNVAIVEAISSHPSIVTVGCRIKVLPLYVLLIYSLSHLCIIYKMKERLNESILTDDIVFWPWYGIFLVTMVIFAYVIHYANKDKIISFGYTIFVIFLTWLTLEWKTLIPYFHDISKMFHCVTETYVKEHNLTIKHNESKCVPD